jgi:hypothetical protein
LGYEEASGPALFDSLASELADNSLEITSASAKRLYNAFQRGFQSFDTGTTLKPMHLLESLKINNEPAPPNELIVSRVSIDRSTGRCPRSETKLRLINLDTTQKEKFQNGLLYLCSLMHEERHQKKTIDVDKEFEKFQSWLEEQGKETQYTAILDGPNIAYYMQNFEQGTFNYHQIKFVVDALEGMGEKVLVVLPKKYSQDTFLLYKDDKKLRQKLTAKERSIRDDLLSSGRAYIVPSGLLDDLYCMYASIVMKEDYIPPENSEGRWPGIRPMLVSNDKLRDHRMALLEPRLFRRWYSNFIVNFTFSAFVGDKCIDREIGFRTADFYSREIQGNPSLNHSNKEIGTVWHFPVADWDESECLCIRIPTSTTD